MFGPLLFQGLFYLFFTLRVDDMHLDRVLLLEAVRPVNSLNEVVEAVIDP